MRHENIANLVAQMSDVDDDGEDDAESLPDARVFLDGPYCPNGEDDAGIAMQSVSRV